MSVLLPDADHDTYGEHYKWRMDDISRYLLELFDAWWLEADVVRVPIFDNLLRRIMGFGSFSESIGNMSAPTIVIETDGSMTAHDVIRTNSIQLTHVTLQDNKIEGILNDDVFRSINMGSFEPGYVVRCQSCPVFNICGAGFVAHRFSRSTGFNNHSVYCSVLFDLINHAYLRLHENKMAR